MLRTNASGMTPPPYLGAVPSSGRSPRAGGESGLAEGDGSPHGKGESGAVPLPRSLAAPVSRLVGAVQAAVLAPSSANDAAFLRSLGSAADAIMSTTASAPGTPSLLAAPAPHPSGMPTTPRPNAQSPPFASASASSTTNPSTAASNANANINSNGNGSSDSNSGSSDASTHSGSTVRLAVSQAISEALLRLFVSHLASGPLEPQARMAESLYKLRVVLNPLQIAYDWWDLLLRPLLHSPTLGLATAAKVRALTVMAMCAAPPELYPELRRPSLSKPRALHDALLDPDPASGNASASTSTTGISTTSDSTSTPTATPTLAPAPNTNPLLIPAHVLTPTPVPGSAMTTASRHAMQTSMPVTGPPAVPPLSFALAQPEEAEQLGPVPGPPASFGSNSTSTPAPCPAAASAALPAASETPLNAATGSDSSSSAGFLSSSGQDPSTYAATSAASYPKAFPVSGSTIPWQKDPDPRAFAQRIVDHYVAEQIKQGGCLRPGPDSERSTYALQTDHGSPHLAHSQGSSTLQSDSRRDCERTGHDEAAECNSSQHNSLDDNSTWQYNLSEIMMQFGQDSPLYFFHHVAHTLLRPQARLCLLELLVKLGRHAPNQLYQVTRSRLVHNLLLSLELDTSKVVVTIGLRVLTMLVPHIPDWIASGGAGGLPALLSVLARIVDWRSFSAGWENKLSAAKNEPAAHNKRSDPDRSDVESDAQGQLSDQDRDQDADRQRAELHLDHLDLDRVGQRTRLKPGVFWDCITSSADQVVVSHPDAQPLFTFLYGIFPCNTVRFFREPIAYLQTSGYVPPFQGGWEDVIDQRKLQARVRPLLKRHLLHPSIITLDAQQEIMDTARWSGYDANIVATKSLRLYLGGPWWRGAGKQFTSLPDSKSGVDLTHTQDRDTDESLSRGFATSTGELQEHGSGPTALNDLDETATRSVRTIASPESTAAASTRELCRPQRRDANQILSQFTELKRSDPAFVPSAASRTVARTELSPTGSVGKSTAKSAPTTPAAATLAAVAAASGGRRTSSGPTGPKPRNSGSSGASVSSGTREISRDTSGSMSRASVAPAAVAASGAISQASSVEGASTFSTGEGKLPSSPHRPSASSVSAEQSSSGIARSLNKKEDVASGSTVSGKTSQIGAATAFPVVASTLASGLFAGSPSSSRSPSLTRPASGGAGKPGRGRSFLRDSLGSSLEGVHIHPLSQAVSRSDERQERSLSRSKDGSRSASSDDPKVAPSESLPTRTSTTASAATAVHPSSRTAELPLISTTLRGSQSHGGPAVDSVSASTCNTNQHELERKILLLRNELDYEMYLQEQHLTHMGHVHAKRIQHTATEVEHFNLESRVRQLTLQLSQLEQDAAEERERVAQMVREYKHWKSTQHQRQASHSQSERLWKREKAHLTTELHALRAETQRIARQLQQEEADKEQLRGDYELAKPKLDLVEKYADRVRQLTAALAHWDGDLARYDLQREEMRTLLSNWSTLARQLSTSQHALLNAQARQVQAEDRAQLLEAKTRQLEREVEAQRATRRELLGLSRQSDEYESQPQVQGIENFSKDKGRDVKDCAVIGREVIDQGVETQEISARSDSGDLPDTACNIVPNWSAFSPSGLASSKFVPPLATSHMSRFGEASGLGPGSHAPSLALYTESMAQMQSQAQAEREQLMRQMQDLTCELDEMRGYKHLVQVYQQQLAQPPADP